jgi:hypothetical protein
MRTKFRSQSILLALLALSTLASEVDALETKLDQLEALVKQLAAHN